MISPGGFWFAEGCFSFGLTISMDCVRVASRHRREFVLPDEVRATISRVVSLAFNDVLRWDEIEVVHILAATNRNGVHSAGHRSAGME